MSFAIVAFPDMTDENYRWIDTIREKYPALVHEAIKPHFTIVFPFNADIAPEKITRHIDTIVNKTVVFRFVILCAVPSPDRMSKRHYVFLVPDEGFSNIIRLHDSLYTGVFEPHLNHEIPYLPHITIGHCDDAQLIRQISLEINEENIEFSGTINQLDVLDNADSRWKTIQTFNLSS